MCISTTQGPAAPIDIYHMQLRKLYISNDPLRVAADNARRLIADLIIFNRHTPLSCFPADEGFSPECDEMWLRRNEAGMK